MKTYFLLLLTFLLMLSSAVYGQKKENNSGESDEPTNEKSYVKVKTRKIIYDFKTGEYEKDLKKIRVHTPVIFEIQNINPFANRVVIKSTDSIVAASNMSFDTESGLNVKEFRELLISLINVKTENGFKTENSNEEPQNPTTPQNNENEEKNRPEETTISTELKTQMEKLNENIDSLKSSSKKEMEKTKSQLNDLLESLRKQIDTLKVKEISKDEFESLEKRLDSIEESMKKNLDNGNLSDIEKRNSEILNIIENIYKKSGDEFLKFKFYNEAYMNSYDSFMKDVRNIYDMVYYAGQIFLIAERPNLTFNGIEISELKDYRKGLENNMKYLREYYTTHSELDDKYQSFVDIGNTISKGNSEAARMLKNAKYLKDKADRIFKVLTESKTQENLKRAIWMAKTLEVEDNFKIISGPIQPENDMLQFEVKIERRDPKALDKFETDKSFFYRQYIYGGTRVDFSLGLAGAYYWDVPEYYIGTKDGEENRILKNTKGMIYPSLIGAVTMSKRSTRYITWGASAGMGLNVDNGKMELSNFFVGPTILFGKKERIFFTVGPSLRNVKMLKSEYEDFVVTPPINDFSSYTQNYYKIGLFFSLTYSLTKNARETLKSLR